MEQTSRDNPRLYWCGNWSPGHWNGSLVALYPSWQHVLGIPWPCPTKAFSRRHSICFRPRAELSKDKLEESWEGWCKSWRQRSWLETWSGLMEERNAEGARLGRCFGKGKQWAERQALPLGWRGGREGPVTLPQRALGPPNHAGLLSSLPSPLGLRTLQTCLSESCPRPHGGDSGSRTT